MRADAYFLLTALPPLDPPGAAPPLTLPELVERVAGGRAGALVRCIVLSDDLLQREAALAGELTTPSPAVLTADQARGAAPLPDEIAPPLAADAAAGDALRLPADLVWAAYYRHATDLGRRLGSEFLRAWAGSEVAVRNAIAAVRARTLGLDPARYLVARSLESDDSGADGAVAAVAGAADPLVALRELLALRWRWIDQREPRYSFSDDEFAAYAAKLVLLHRWQRSAGEPRRRQPVDAVEVGS